LVTGGAGFVGATLVRRLVATGYRVRVLDNFSTGDPSHLAGVDAELVKGDICNAAALDDAIEGMRAVIHLAAAGSVIGSVQDPVMNFEVNVLGTFNVLDAARRAGVERVVLASTGGALIGDAAPPVDERSLPKPISPPTGRASWPAKVTRTLLPRRTGFAPSLSGSATCTDPGAPASAACSTFSSNRSTRAFR